MLPTKSTEEANELTTERKRGEKYTGCELHLFVDVRQKNYHEIIDNCHERREKRGRRV